MTVDPLAEPSRIAFAGDWHENASWAESAIAHAKDQGADVIVHLGDFGYHFSRPFLRRVSTALAHAQIPLLFVDGNHEHHRRLLAYPIGSDGLREITGGVWHLPRGFRWTWADVRFLALGGAYSVDRPWRRPGLEWWPEEAITEDQAAHATAGGPADVLIAHDCPHGVDIPGLQPDLFPPLEILRAEEHRQVLRRVVDVVQPRMIWHGHYHQDYEQTAEFGYGPVHVAGLDCDGTTLSSNVRVVDLADLADPVQRPQRPIGEGS